MRSLDLHFKEQILERFKAMDSSILTWMDAKNFGLGITRHKFHKYCDELVADGKLLNGGKISGVLMYEIKKEKVHNGDRYCANCGEFLGATCDPFGRSSCAMDCFE